MTKLDELKALCEAATKERPKPTIAELESILKLERGDVKIQPSGQIVVGAEADFYVAARTYLPKLIKVAEAAERVDELMDCWKESRPPYDGFVQRDELRLALADLESHE